jgi:hypothetical protein
MILGSALMIFNERFSHGYDTLTHGHANFGQANLCACHDSGSAYSYCPGHGSASNDQPDPGY